ncbi:MAG: GPW/gp25 family protein [bacterium]|nr:GPW/gp25 family protein [bacterium]
MFNSVTGRGWSFPPRLNDRDRIAMVQDDLEIRQAIYIIINTVPGERLMHPDFGCEIHELVFAPANDETAAMAERYVTEALIRWEPRITLTSVRVTPGGTERGELVIEVEYRIHNDADRRSLVYPFYLLPNG